MKVTDVYTSALVASSRVRRRRRLDEVEGPAPSAPATDQVLFSQRSVEVQRARTVALQAPEIRDALVDEIFAQINQGRYKVSGADVAPRMLQEHAMLARL